MESHLAYEMATLMAYSKGTSITTVLVIQMGMHWGSKTESERVFLMVLYLENLRVHEKVNRLVQC